MSSDTYAYYKACQRLGLSVVGTGRLFGAHPRTAQRWAHGESPIPWQVNASLTLMLRHELKPSIVVNDTLAVPRMDQIVIALLQQTGETLESALQGFKTR
jgi:hypothetical protein